MLIHIIEKSSTTLLYFSYQKKIIAKEEDINVNKKNSFNKKKIALIEKIALTEIL